MVKATNERHQQVNKNSEKGGHATRARAVASRRRRYGQSTEIKLAELRRRLLEINDLSAAGAVLRWDHATYMPRCGATARLGRAQLLGDWPMKSRLPRSSASCSMNLSHTRPVYPTSPMTRASYALQDATSRRRSKCPPITWRGPARSVLRPTTLGNERGRRTTLRPWCHFWKGLSILVASTQTSSPPMSMSPTLSLIMPSGRSWS